MPRKLICIFIAAFLLNFLWEQHTVLYEHYKGADITQLILLRSALFDAGVITLLFLIFNRARHREVWVMLIAFIFAVALERWALGSARWAYNDMMPIVPLLEVGLSPILQLPLTAFVSVRVADISRRLPV
ncbi:MAG: hypothetical protein Q7R88_01640 [bacterium]|nr:hypothetical protein [bacterium]